MNASVVVAPILVPLVAALFGALGPRRPGYQRTVGLLGAFGLFVAAMGLLASVFVEGVIAVQIGDWPAPFGITLAADRLSAAMVAATGLVAFTVVLYSTAEIPDDVVTAGFYPFVHVLLLGVCGAFVAGDLFNLYVWFEVMLLASFVLLALGSGRAALTSSITYVALNLLASAFFLIGVGFLYGQVGTLNFADLSLKLGDPAALDAARPAALLLLIAFGIKAGVFPVFFWLPAAYPNASFAVSALFAGLLTKVGVYALLRVFTLVFPLEALGLAPGLLAVAAATMASGVLAAASQAHVRRILSFHIVSQIGYMVLALALVTTLGLASAVFYIVHHIVTKTNLFLVGGLIARAGGSEQLDQIGGLSQRRLGLTMLFAIPALSLAGVPPFSGFFAKFFLIRSALEADAIVAVTFAVVVGLLTIYSMAKIWIEAFWKPAPAETHLDEPLPRAALVACAMLAVVTITLGVGAEALWSFALATAEQLADPQEYLNAVLGDPT